MAQGLLLAGRRLLQTRKVTLKQNRRGNPIDDTFPFPAPDVGGDQQILRRTGRHPFIPGHHGNRQGRFEQVNKFLNHFGCRTTFPVQPKRQTDEHLTNLVLAH